MRLSYVLFVCLPVMLSCKRASPLAVDDSSKSTRSVADEIWYRERPDRPFTIEEGGELMSGLAINIQSAMDARGLVLRFRLKNPEAGAEVPLIQGVMVEKAGEREVTCEVKSEGYMPMGEWHYNDEPFGFKKLSCRPLVRGEYEVFVYGYHSQGESHLSIGENGLVNSMR